MSENISNSSATEAATKSGRPLLSASPFGPQYTPGPVNMTYQPFYTSTPTTMGTVPGNIPFSSPDLRRGSLTCNVVTINGLEKGQGCTVVTGANTVTVDLTGTNPFTFVNGANKVTVTGDPQMQMCNVAYSDNFDSSSFYVQPNGRFETCI